MKGAVILGKHQIEIRDDLPKPEVLSNEVLIKVKYCGICGSGIESYESGGMYLPGIVIGHEFSGEIAEVGDNVRKWKIGHRVTVNPNVPCYDCYWCNHYQENMCKLSNNGLGTTQNGGMAEYINVKAERLHALPDSMSFKAGATVEPLANCVYAIQQSGLKIGDSVAVIGAGTIGLMTIQALKVAGAGSIYVIEPVESKQKKALELGAEKVLKPNAWNKIVRLTNKIGPDHVFDCVGLPETYMTSMNLVKRGGQITLIGIHAEPFEMKGFMQLMLKNISMKGVFSFNQEVFATSLNLIAESKVNVDPIITKTIKIEEVPAMFKTLANPPHEEINVLVELD